MTLAKAVRAVLALLPSLAAAAPAHAADWPARPVRVVVPSTPAGAIDVLSRLVAHALSEKWKQPVVVDNRPGADGIIGTQLVPQAKPDGYTLLVTTTGFITNPFLYKSVPYDPVKDFEPVTILASTPNVLLAHPPTAFPTLPELIAAARKAPGSIAYGSSGVGSVGQLSFVLLEKLAGIKLTHVPYRGAGTALNGVLAGDVPILITAVGAALPYVKSGLLVPVAVSTERRLDLLPDVPTFIEAGLTQYKVVGWYGLFAPAGTPKEIVDKLFGDAKEVLAAPELSRQITELGFSIDPPTPSAYKAYLTEDLARWRDTIATAGMKPEP